MERELPAIGVAMFCAIDRYGCVLAVGRFPDDTIAQLWRHELSRVWRIFPCTDDVVACFVAGNDVLVRVENRVADI